MDNSYRNLVSKTIEMISSSLLSNQIVEVSELIINAITDHRRIHITGVGKPSYVAGYSSSLLSSLGCPTYYLDATECIHGSAGQVVFGDIVIAISNSGATKEIIAATNTLKENGATIIGISGASNSQLALMSHIHLLCQVDREGDNLNLPPRLSIISQIYILQLISLKVQDELDLKLEDYLKWHPAGKIGDTARENLL